MRSALVAAVAVVVAVLLLKAWPFSPSPDGERAIGPPPSASDVALSLTSPAPITAEEPALTQPMSPTDAATSMPCVDAVKTTIGIVEEPPIGAAALWAVSVFVGHVVDVGAARWNRDDPDARPGSSDWIYTPLTIVIDAVIRGAEKPGDKVGDKVVVPVAGGTVGCDRQVIRGLPSGASVGDEFAVFLIDPALVRFSGRLTGIFPVADGLVTTAGAGTMTVDELRAAVEATGYLPFPEVPTPNPR